MSTLSQSDQQKNRLTQWLLWCLRFVLLVQCIGVGGRYYFSENETESDVYGLLYFDHEWPEETAQRIDDIGTLACFGAGWVILLAGFLRLGEATSYSLGERIALILEAVAGLTILSWMLTLSVTHMIRGELYAELTLGEHAVRYLVPVAFLLISWRAWNPSSTYKLARWLLAIACAATFLVHGYKAIQIYGQFTDLILLTDAEWFGLELEQSTTESILFVIGVVDIIVAVLVVAIRFRAVALYMVIWGVMTASSRMTAFGIAAWPETLIRVANWGAPLALVLLLTISRSESSHSVVATDTEIPILEPEVSR